MNGNKTKGNQGRKARKDAIVYFDDTQDQYARIEKLNGVNHVDCLTLKGEKNILQNVIIPGKFYKRVWFKIGDIVIVQPVEEKYEIKGRPDESEIKKLKDQFEKISSSKGDSKTIIRFGDSDDEQSDDEDEVVPVKTKKTVDSVSDVNKAVPENSSVDSRTKPQPIEDFDDI